MSYALVPADKAVQLLLVVLVGIGAFRLFLLTEAKLYKPVRDSADNFVKVFFFAFLLLFALSSEFSLKTAPVAALMGLAGFVAMETWKWDINRVFVIEALAMLLAAPV